MTQAAVATAPETDEHIFNLGKRAEKFNRLAKLCINDLHFLVTQVLYAHDAWKYGPMHKWMCETVGREKRQLWLLPRDHFKSTILTVGYCVQCILRAPMESNLILSAKDEHALAFSNEIRSHFINNQFLRALFPPWCTDREWDSKSEWTSPAKAKFGGKRREPTVIATGFKSRLESRHYNRGFFDDCITVEDTTEPGIAASLEDFRKAVPLIDKDGEIIMPGTRKHYADLYSKVIESGAYSVYIRHGLEHATKMCEMVTCAAKAVPHKAADFHTGTPLEEVRYSRADYDQKLRECEVDPKLGTSFFWHEYMNVPFSPSDRKFQPEWFKQVDDDMIPGRVEPFHPLNKFLAIDSAWKEEEHPSGYDYTAMGVGGFDNHGNLFVLDMLRDRTWTMKQGADVAITLMKAYGISRVITEKVGQVTFHTYFKDRCRQANIPVIFITPKRGGAGSKGKTSRIMASQGYFEQGKVYFRAGIDNFEEAKDEFCNLGRWTNDDLADMLADFFDEQVKVLEPHRGSPNANWKPPLRPMPFESRAIHSAFNSFNPRDPLGRFGQDGPATTREPFSTGHFNAGS